MGTKVRSQGGTAERFSLSFVGLPTHNTMVSEHSDKVSEDRTVKCEESSGERDTSGDKEETVAL